jgi:hypothetical protein
MQGIDQPLAAKAIDPMHDGDHRLHVHELISQHRLAIDQLAEALRTGDDPLYQPSKHDDLWILRFVLSHQGKHSAALKAIRHTLAYRQEHGWDERDIRYSVPGTSSSYVDCPAMLTMKKYNADDTFQWCLPHGDRGTVCLFARIAGSDQHGLVANVDESMWRDAFQFVTEWAFQWCDYITRTTGRLTKNLRLIDLAGLSFRDVNSEVSRRDSRNMAITEDCYPQLLQAVVLCHGPQWVMVIWRLVRPLLPHRVIEKVDFMNPTANETERRRLRTILPAEVLPVRFGGVYQTWPVQFGLPQND